jgi:hypothetical protein
MKVASVDHSHGSSLFVAAARLIHDPPHKKSAKTSKQQSSPNIRPLKRNIHTRQHCHTPSKGTPLPVNLCDSLNHASHVSCCFRVLTLIKVSINVSSSKQTFCPFLCLFSFIAFDFPRLKGTNHFPSILTDTCVSLFKLGFEGSTQKKNELRSPNDRAGSLQIQPMQSGPLDRNLSRWFLLRIPLKMAASLSSDREP